MFILTVFIPILLFLSVLHAPESTAFITLPHKLYIIRFLHSSLEKGNYLFFYHYLTKQSTVRLSELNDG